MGPAGLEWPTGSWEIGRSGPGRSWRGEEERKVGDGADRWGRSVGGREGQRHHASGREAGLTGGPRRSAEGACVRPERAGRRREAGPRGKEGAVAGWAGLLGWVGLGLVGLGFLSLFFFKLHSNYLNALNQIKLCTMHKHVELKLILIPCEINYS